jgi:hypothetical protein
MNGKGGDCWIVAIMCSNHRAFTAYLLEEDGCHCHCQRGLLGAATIVEEELELAATFVKEELELAATFVKEELELAATIIDKRVEGAAMNAYK